MKIPSSETISREGLMADIAWLAGFFDGEGRIIFGFYANGTASWRMLRCDCVIANTHVAAIEKATRIMAELEIKFKVQVTHQGNGKWKPQMRIVTCGQTNSTNFLRVLVPFLTCKKQQAEQVIAACEYRKSLTRAGNNQYTGKREVPIQEDQTLLAMIERAREFLHYRPDPLKYSRVANEPIRLQKPSEAIRSDVIQGIA